jgi:hypothetical protein
VFAVKREKIPQASKQANDKDRKKHDKIENNRIWQIGKIWKQVIPPSSAVDRMDLCEPGRSDEEGIEEQDDDLCDGKDESNESRDGYGSGAGGVSSNEHPQLTTEDITQEIHTEQNKNQKSTELNEPTIHRECPTPRLTINQQIGRQE